MCPSASSILRGIINLNTSLLLLYLLCLHVSPRWLPVIIFKRDCTLSLVSVPTLPNMKTVHHAATGCSYLSEVPFSFDMIILALLLIVLEFI